MGIASQARSGPAESARFRGEHRRPGERPLAASTRSAWRLCLTSREEVALCNVLGTAADEVTAI